MTPFLYRVGMSKLFCSFSVGFNSAFYFVKGPIKTEHDTLGFDWMTSKSLLILSFCEALLIIAKINRFDFNVNRYRYYQYYTYYKNSIRDKSKHCKWNVVKLSTEAAICKCSSK